MALQSAGKRQHFLQLLPDTRNVPVMPVMPVVNEVDGTVVFGLEAVVDSAVTPSYAAAVPVLSAHHLHKAFGERVLLGDVSLSLRTGERVGLVGRNGCGKSTLAKILASVEPSDGGELSLRRGAKVAYLEQAPTFAPEETPRSIVTSGLAAWSAAKARYDALSARIGHATSEQNALLAEHAELAAELERLGGWEREHEVEAMLGHLGIHRLDGTIGSMSGGERRRVALARLLVARPDLAVLDEPTNHLDVDTIDWLEEYLLETFTGAVLLITHDRYLLDRVCTRTLELERGELHSYDGGYETYLRAKAEREALQERTESNRRNFLRTELEWLARQPKARTTKSKARIDRAEAAKANVPPPQEKTATLSIEGTRAGKTILEAQELTLAIEGRTLVRKLTLHLSIGDRIGIVGPNGTGKTTLLRAIVGELAPTDGRVVVGKNTKMVYFDQERSGLDPDKSIFDNIKDQGAIEVGNEVLDTRSYLERFLFDTYEQRKKVGALSGGERARVALARVLRSKANVVLLDEPTNDLDVATLGALEDMLLSFAGCTLVVTHDRWFLDRLATALLVFEEDGNVVLSPGNYEAYRRLREERRKDAQAKDAADSKSSRSSNKPSAPPPNNAAPKERKKGLSYAQRLELEALPQRIDEAERRVAELEAKTCAPEFYRNDADAVKRTLADLETRRGEVTALLSRWEELEAQNGG